MQRFIKEFMEREQPAGMIFDVDGTILDSMPVWLHSGERYLASIGVLAPPSLGKILFSMTMYQGAEYMKETYGLAQEPEEIMSAIIGSVAQAYEKEIPCKPGMHAFLRALRQRGVPMTIVTSSDKKLVLAAFRRLGIASYFTDILTCTEFGSGKDQPEIFQAAASIMHAGPSSLWVVEDGLYAVRTAAAAGYRTIGIFDEASREDEAQIRKLADYYVDFKTMERSSYERIYNADGCGKKGNPDRGTEKSSG